MARFRRGPLHRLANVELLTAERVHWYNTSHLIHRRGRTPPVEFEAIWVGRDSIADQLAVPVTVATIAKRLRDDRGVNV